MTELSSLCFSGCRDHPGVLQYPLGNRDGFSLFQGTVRLRSVSDAFLQGTINTSLIRKQRNQFILKHFVKLDIIGGAKRGKHVKNVL